MHGSKLIMLLQLTNGHNGQYVMQSYRIATYHTAFIIFSM